MDRRSNGGFAGSTVCVGVAPGNSDATVSVVERRAVPVEPGRDWAEIGLGLARSSGYASQACGRLSCWWGRSPEESHDARQRGAMTDGRLDRRSSAGLWNEKAHSSFTPFAEGHTPSTPTAPLPL